MTIWQNPDLLSMIGLGTHGGQPRADGSLMEPGIHLRWQVGETLGYPPYGFDLYRREQNLDLFVRCGFISKTVLGDLVWVPGTPASFLEVELSASGDSRTIEGCGKISSILLPGEQTLQLDFKEHARHIRIIFDKNTPHAPTATAYWRSASGPVTVDIEAAKHKDGGEWILRVFSDSIDTLVLHGEDMIICEICAVLTSDGYGFGWDPLPLNDPLPIYLPVTHPEWYSPHAHSPDDQAEAESRLPTSLPIEKQRGYADGFATDLHGILYDLVGTYPQNLQRITEPDEASGATLDWPTLQLLKLIALDPDLARILGLYWRDVPPNPDRYYDYRLEAHYKQGMAPGYSHSYSSLEADEYLGMYMVHEGLVYASPNPMTIIRAEWDGAEMNALFVGSTIPGAPLAITLPHSLKSVTFEVFAQSSFTARAYAANQIVSEYALSPGEVTFGFEYPDGLEAVVLFSDGDLTIFEIVLRQELTYPLNVVYETFHHRVEVPPPVPAPELEAPIVFATRTGLDEEGTLMQNQSSLGLIWNLNEAGGDFLSSHAPVFYQVRRADRGNGEQPDPLTTWTILNQDGPVLVTENVKWEGPELDAVRVYYTDRNLPDGWYSYQVRGIDLFGRLGKWSRVETARVLDQLPPPPPQAVSASYLDPLDPWLSQADKDWAIANGPGLKVSWEWPGILRLQTPDIIPPNAEFRVYIVNGELNTLSGIVNTVTENPTTSTLATSITWNGAPDDLAGESIRVGNNFFEVTGNTTGQNSTITVTNLTSPILTPIPGPCSLVFNRDRDYWTDYAVTRFWEVRLHSEPVAEIPTISGLVLRVEDIEADAITRPGATRTVITDQMLPDEDGVLTPGALLCEGVVYPAYGHKIEGELHIYIAPQTSPTDFSNLVEPPPNAPFVYYPGRRYEAYGMSFELMFDSLKGTAYANVAVSCSDGKDHVEDDPGWDRPERGGLGNRPGNEGPLSLPSKVVAVKRTAPPAPRKVKRATVPIYAKPANYYGEAHYSLTWEPVPGAVGYAVYRCSGEAFFAHDLKQRKYQKDYYTTHDVFIDDAGFEDWLAAYDASLSKGELVDHPDQHPEAWKAWAAHYYPTLTDADIQRKANRKGNEKALRRINKDPVESTSYLDTFDGRGQGFYLYRVRAIDAADNLGEWSSTYAPVHIYDVTPPAMPVINSILSGESRVILLWMRGTESDLSEYHVWRSESKDALSDIRRQNPILVLQAEPASVMTYVDEGLVGLRDYFYRIAAVDTSGNVSNPTAVIAAHAIDTQPPNPPEWMVAEWISDSSGPGIRLAWQSDEESMTCYLERRPLGGGVWTGVSQDIHAGASPLDFEFIDRSAVPDTAYEYRVLGKDLAGNSTIQFNIQQVWPEE